jgi:hypothetical protein
MRVVWPVAFPSYISYYEAAFGMDASIGRSMGTRVSETAVLEFGHLGVMELMLPVHSAHWRMGWKCNFSYIGHGRWLKR